MRTSSVWGVDFLLELEDVIEEGVQRTAPDARWGVSWVLKPSFPGNARPIVKGRVEK